jgi:hypothetical protein
LLAGLVKDGVRHMAFGNQRDRLSPRQRRPLAIGEEWSLRPSVERIQALLGLAFCPSILGMHVNAVSASVDL